jgi:hypothetical protein
MKPLRVFFGMLLVSVVGATGYFVTTGLNGQPASSLHVMDRRCRGGCTDTALLRILPGGSGPIATGALSGSKGQTVTTTRASNKTCTKADGTLVYLGNNQPCVETAGVLVEGASTNLLLQSGDLSNVAWSVNNSGSSNPVVTANACAAPDGTTTAARVDLPSLSTSTQAQLFQAFSTSGGTASLWVRSYDGVSTGTAQLYTLGTANWNKNVNYTGTWTRFGNTNPGATSYFVFGQSNGVTAFSGDTPPSSASARSVCVWGAQGEGLQFFTSYIPTTTTSASRAADVVSVANPFVNGDTKFCAAFSATPAGGASWALGTTRVFANTSGNFASNGSLNWWVATFNAPSVDVLDSAGNDVSYNGATLSDSLKHRFNFCTQKPSTTTYQIDSSAPVGSVSGSTLGTLTQAGTLYLGSANGGSPFNGWMSDVCLANQAGSCR